MKYIAVFEVEDNWFPDQWNPGARASFKDPSDYYHTVRAEIKAMPMRIPEQWKTKEAEGFNACLDAIEADDFSMYMNPPERP